MVGLTEKGSGLYVLRVRPNTILRLAWTKRKKANKDDDQIGQVAALLQDKMRCVVFDMSLELVSCIVIH